MCKKAVQFANKLGCNDFQASVGWLFKNRNGIVFRNFCGESASDNYSEDDTFSPDEIGLFFKCLLDKLLHLRKIRALVENAVRSVLRLWLHATCR